MKKQNPDRRPTNMRKEAFIRLWGEHVIVGLVDDSAAMVHRLWLEKKNDPRLDKLAHMANERGISVEYWDRKQFDACCQGRHQGIMAEVSLPHQGNEASLKDRLRESPVPGNWLVLDGITDVHNFGACMRSAAAAGVDGIILPARNSAPLNPEACRIASGAAHRLSIYRVANLARTLRLLRDHGVWIIGTAAEGTVSLYDADMAGPLALVLGSEHEGLRQLTRRLCDQMVFIPMANGFESLNVSVAAGICLFEWKRRAPGVLKH